MTAYRVYALSAEPGGPMRYIGVTSRPVDVRLTQHLARARRAQTVSPFHAWLRRGRPQIRILSVASDREAARAAERRAIETARRASAPLFNRYAGGTLSAAAPRDVTARDRTSALSRRNWARDREAVIAAQTAGKRRPEARARQSQAQRRAWRAPGLVRRQSVAHARKLTASDVRAVLRALAAGESQRGIAVRFGVWQSHISRIKHGRAWRHLTD